MKRANAFTLLELLTVVAVIAILAAIAVPNFLEAQTRAKTATTKSDMAVLSAALKAYFCDYNRYPPNNPEVREFLQASLAHAQVNRATLPTPTTATLTWTANDPETTTPKPVVPSSDPFAYPGLGTIPEREDKRDYPILYASDRDLRVLTTPVAYFGGELPRELYQANFHNDSDSSKPGYYFTYLNLADLETTASIEGSMRPASRYLLLSAGPDHRGNYRHPVRGPFLPYDPTNGTVSPGEIIEAH